MNNIKNIITSAIVGLTTSCTSYSGFEGYSCRHTENKYIANRGNVEVTYVKIGEEDGILEWQNIGLTEALRAIDGCIKSLDSLRE